jgi:hypothetical protein
MEVGIAYLELVDEVGVEHVTVTAIAKRAKVSWDYAKTVVEEYKNSNNQ